MINDLTKRLTEHADWCDANEWEIPITLGDDLRAAAARIKALTAENAALYERTRWISVNERLPNGWIMVDETTNYREPEEYIVFINGAEGPTTAYCIDGKFVPLCTIEGCSTPKCIGYADKVTYWMPMPEPPKEEK